MSSKKKRSEAQIEASRKNGAKSKGPVTDEGKRASRQNALKHGLTAKFLKPRSDTRNQDQLFDRVYQELMDEYDPQSFTAESTVSNLTHDYVQMIRCRQMLEKLQQPASLSAKDLKDWENLQATQQEHRSVSAALAMIVAHQDIEFRPEEALNLAKAVAQYMAEVEELKRKHDEKLLIPYGADGKVRQNTPSDKPDDAGEQEFIPQEEYEEQIEEWAYLQPVCRRLSDLEHLTAMFRGQAVPTPIVRKRLYHVLNRIERHLDLAIFEHKELQRRANALSDQKLMQLANEPEQIMRLERYLRDIERSIDRKMKQLADQQFLGSFRENDD